MTAINIFMDYNGGLVYIDFEKYNCIGNVNTKFCHSTFVIP